MTCARLGVLLLLVVSCAGAPARAAEDATYSGNGFTITYPGDWKVNPNFVDKGYRFFQGDADDTRAGVAFSPTTDLAPGTALQSDQLMLVVERARPADICVAASFLADPPPDYFTKRIVDKPEAVQTMAEAGDLYTIEHIVVMVSRTPCIAVQYFIVASRDRALKPFDHAKLVNYLNSIATTVKAQ